MTMLADTYDYVIGVDTHKQSHTAAVVAGGTGAVLEHTTVSATTDGYAELALTADRFSTSRVWALEGACGYGAGLARFLTERGERVIEIDRPDRPTRRDGVKNDEVDATRAARDALARDHVTDPRAQGARAALAVLLAARDSAVEGVKVAKQQLHALVVTAPDTLRDKLRDQSTTTMIATAAKLRPSSRTDLQTRTTATVLRDLARRCQTLQREADDHEHAIRTIVNAWRPDLLAEPGVGPIVAATVLCAWSHTGRFRHEAAFAKLAGVCPLEASTGLTSRHRLNRHGDRQLNRMIHVIVLCRLRYDPETRAYAERRRSEGKTDREIKRCLKRYVARRLFKLLEQQPADSP